MDILLLIGLVANAGLVGFVAWRVEAVFRLTTETHERRERARAAVGQLPPGMGRALLRDRLERIAAKRAARQG